MNPQDLAITAKSTESRTLLVIDWLDHNEHSETHFIALPLLRHLSHWKAEAIQLRADLEQRQQDWQPIATAPRDGTPVLAHTDAWAMPSILVWLDGPGLGNPGWRHFERSPLGPMGRQPTVWMPVPIAPWDAADAAAATRPEPETSD